MLLNCLHFVAGHLLLLRVTELRFPERSTLSFDPLILMPQIRQIASRWGREGLFVGVDEVAGIQAESARENVGHRPCSGRSGGFSLFKESLDAGPHLGSKLHQIHGGRWLV